MAPEVGRGTRGRKAPEALQCVHSRELVVAETDLRSAEAELEEGTEQAADAWRTRRQPRERVDAPALVDEPRDRHADEDGRLLDGAHPAPHLEAIEVRERERHTLVGEAPAAAPDIGSDPAIHVRVGDRVGVAQPDPDAGGIDLAAQERLEDLGPEGPVELVRLPPLARHRDDREHLLLPGRQAVAEAAHQLGGGRLHRRMGRVLLHLASRHDDVQLGVRIARPEQRAQRRRDPGLLPRRHQVHEDRRRRVVLERGLVGQRVEGRVRALDEATGGEHALPVEQKLEGGAAVDDERRPEHREPEPPGAPEPGPDRVHAPLSGG